MPRPMKRRRVCQMPGRNEFGPLGMGGMKKEQILMAVDEYEVIRLMDLEGLTQEECAEQMEVARTTVQRIYQEARKKLAQMLIEGKRVVIQGGNIQLCEDWKPGVGRGQRMGGHGGNGSGNGPRLDGSGRRGCRFQCVAARKVEEAEVKKIEVKEEI